MPDPASTSMILQHGRIGISGVSSTEAIPRKSSEEATAPMATSQYAMIGRPWIGKYGAAK